MKEVRVFGVIYTDEIEDVYSLGNNEFMDIAERQGHVYTLHEFATCYNSEEVPYDLFIRFIAVDRDSDFIEKYLYLNSKQKYSEILK